MSRVFEYKGFQGSVEFDLENGFLYGKVLHITDLIDYNANTLNELKQEFYAAVDGYLQLCAELGCEPDKPASGTFNVRIGPEMHTSAARVAAMKGVSLNEFVKSAVLDALGHYSR